jgi:hypothetical protein
MPSCRSPLIAVLLGALLPCLPAADTVSIVASDATAAESSPGSGAFTVSRLAATASPLTVIYARSGTARANGVRDYDLSTGDLGSVTIPAGQASAVVIVDPIPDNVHEADESVILTLLSTPEYSTGSGASAIVTIVDDDPVPTVSVQKISDGVENSPGSVGRFRLSLSNGAAPPPTIYFATGGTATSGTDYRPIADSVTFLSELATTADVVVFLTPSSGPPYNDTFYEGTETVTLDLNPGTGYLVGSPSTATVSIHDDDVPPKFDLTISDGLASETGPDSGSFTISTTQPLATDTIIKLSYASSTTVNGVDHAVLPSQVSIPAGGTSVTVQVLPVDDAVNEGPFPETVVITLLPGTGYALGNVLTGSIAISDNDQPTGQFRFLDAAPTVNEASPPITSWQAGVMVERVNGTAGSATVSWATSDGSASAGSDYTASSGTLTWAAGESGFKTIIIPITPDTQIEANETVMLTLSGAVGAALGSPSTAVLTISNDDSSSGGQLRFPQAYLSQTEGSAGTTTLTVQVQRLLGSTGAISVAYATSDGTAIAGTDYTAASGTLNWADGDSASKSFTITISGDTLAEVDETFSVNLSSPGGGASLGPQASVQVTIANDDGGTAGSLAFSAASISFSEGSADRTISIPVLRSGGSTGAVGITYTFTNGSAINGSDFIGSTGSLAWAADDSAAKSINLTLTGDAATEPDKTFTVALSSVSGGAVLGSPSTATVTIVNDDLPPAGTISFETGGSSTPEGNSGSYSVIVTVRRLGGSNGAVSAAFSCTGVSATAGSDFDPVSGILSWPDGNTGDRFIAISILSDLVYEGDETLQVNLSAPSGGAVLGTALNTITISEDDAASGTTAGGGGGGGGGGCGAGATAGLVLLGLAYAALMPLRRRRAGEGP